MRFVTPLVLAWLLAGCGATWSVKDEDGDGFAVTAGDCNDKDGEIGPSATEVWYNGVDENCDGNDDDQDLDGFPGVDAGGADCWDDPSSIPEEFSALNGMAQPAADAVNPDAAEVWYDGLDGNCDGEDDFDQDKDGHATLNVTETRTELPIDDCYDAVDDGYPILADDCLSEPAVELPPEQVYPGATDEVYDGTDADCSGDTDFDKDGDSWPICSDCADVDNVHCGDCDDEDELVYPNDTPEVWYNGVDENCDNNDGDQDFDGYVVEAYSFPIVEGSGLEEGDCWDDPESTPTEYSPINGFPDVASDEVNPAHSDAWYDGIDQNCDDADDFDADADSYATDAYANRASVTGDDCDDAEGAVHPGASEVYYDGTDQNCDGESDYDQDGDGYDSDDYTAGTHDDCDDTRPVVNPGVNEDCGTAFDDDCDTDLNDVGATDCEVYYYDADSDGYGDITKYECVCEPRDTYEILAVTTSNDDCDDSDSGDFPGATESVDNHDDEDCDGVDTCWTDNDLDTYGSTTTKDSNDLDCTDSTEANDDDDCDDTDDDTFPGAAETESATACMNDDDADGYGDATSSALYTEGTDLDDNKSTCTTSLADTDGDGFYNCQDQCADTDGDNYGTTSTAASNCRDASGVTCAKDTACTGTDVNDAMSTCTTSGTYIDTDGDGFYNCQDRCADVDGDNYGTTSTAAALCVTNGASGGTTTCAGDAACTSTDVDDAKSTCTTSTTDTDGDGYYNCQDQCADVDGDNYGTTSTAAALCVTNGASGGTTTCAADAACTSTDLDDGKSTCTTSLTDTDGDGYYNCQDQCADVDGDNYGTTSTAAASCVTNGGSGGTTSCAGDAACTSTDLDDAKSTCTTSLADTDGDGVYNCQDQCADVDGDNYGTTSTAAAACVTNGASGGTTSCAGDAACSSTDIDDAKSTCTTSITDTDGDGYYNCQDQCADVDGDNYGTTSTAAAACVTNGGSGGTTTCAGDSACTSTDVDDAKSTCTTSTTDTDGDGYYNCQDQCADVDGDNYGTTSTAAAACVTNGASGGTTTCAGDSACTAADLDDAKSTCTTSLTDTDGDGVYNCQDQCADVDGDNYGTTSTAAAACVTNGGSGGTTSCAGDAACTSTDINDAMSTCTTSGTYSDTDGDGIYNCQDQCADVDGDNYGTTSTAAAACVTNGASGGTTTCAGDAACTSTDVDDAKSTCTTSTTDTGGDGYYNCQDQCSDVDGDNYGTTSTAAAACVTNGASGGTTTCAGDSACTSTDVDDAKSTCTTSTTDTDGDGYYNCQDQCADVDGDNYGTTSTAAALCVTNGASGGTTSCAADTACTSTDVNDAMSTCTTSATYIDSDGDTVYDCQDQCDDDDGDNYGTTSTGAAACVTNGASGGTTTCAGDAACTDVDCDDTDATIHTGAADPTDGTYLDEDCDGFIDEDGIVAGDVVISEFFLGAAQAYDFIEFYNPTVDDIYLDAWRLDFCFESDNTTTTPPYSSGCDTLLTLTFPTDGTAPIIEAGGYAFICNDNSVQTGTYPCDYEFTYPGAALEPETGLLKLRATSAAQIDQITWWQSLSGLDSWPTSALYSVQLDTADFDYNTNNDYSTTSLTTNADIWCLSASAADWATGSADYRGTPGEPNTTCP